VKPRYAGWLRLLLCAANALTIFLLNMSYDVSVKLPSLNLLVMAVILIAPDLRRLAGVFLFNRRVELARATPLFAHKWLEPLSPWIAAPYKG